MLVVEQLIFIFGVAVISGSYASDLGRGVKQRIGNLTGDNIYLIAIGYRNDHIGILYAGINQYIWVTASADNSAHIEPILQCS